MLKLLSIPVLLFSVILHGQTTVSALFLGNSYTNSNNLLLLIDNLANADGNDLEYDSNTPGGYQLVQHVANSTTISKINSQAWDFVVIQEQSQKPSFPPAQVTTDVYPYAAQLDSMIVANDSCTETVFFMTWGRENGDQSNCTSYPPLCTYEGMQDRLRTSYLEMTVDNDAICAPVGSAWWATRIACPQVSLYTADESHPNINGSYLAACVFYATLFRESPFGVPYYATLTQSNAESLQQIAHNTVFDSLETWQIGKFELTSGFSYVDNGNLTLNFTDTSANADVYMWDFGDGTTSTQQNPSHTYTAGGTYTITLITDNGCTQDTSIATIFTGVTSSNEENRSLHATYIRYNEEIVATFKGRYNVELFALNGQRMFSGTYSEKAIIPVNALPDGIYILRIGDSVYKMPVSKD